MFPWSPAYLIYNPAVQNWERSLTIHCWYVGELPIIIELAHSKIKTWHTFVYHLLTNIYLPIVGGWVYCYPHSYVYSTSFHKLNLYTKILESIPKTAFTVFKWQSALLDETFYCLDKRWDHLPTIKFYQSFTEVTNHSLSISKLTYFNCENIPLTSKWLCSTSLILIMLTLDVGTVGFYFRTSSLFLICTYIWVYENSRILYW